MIPLILAVNRSNRKYLTVALTPATLALGHVDLEASDEVYPLPKERDLVTKLLLESRVQLLGIDIGGIATRRGIEAAPDFVGRVRRRRRRRTISALLVGGGGGGSGGGFRLLEPSL